MDAAQRSDDGSTFHRLCGHHHVHTEVSSDEHQDAEDKTDGSRQNGVQFATPTFRMPKRENPDAVGFSNRLIHQGRARDEFTAGGAIRDLEEESPWMLQLRGDGVKRRSRLIYLKA